MPRRSCGGQSANTCRDLSMSFQKSTATPLGTLSCTSKRARGQDNPPGEPSLGVLLQEDVTCVEGGIFIEKRSELLQKRRSPDRPPTQVDYAMETYPTSALTHRGSSWSEDGAPPRRDSSGTSSCISSESQQVTTSHSHLEEQQPQHTRGRHHSMGRERMSMHSGTSTVIFTD